MDSGSFGKQEMRKCQQLLDTNRHYIYTKYNYYHDKITNEKYEDEWNSYY